MGSISDFLNNMDWWGLLTLLISAAAALLCITLHELSHGFVAWRLGDPTAKNAGRLTLNPIRHLDVVGLLMMLVARWAGPSRCRWICAILSTPGREWRLPP
ncbi:MAG: site-2 protease family protein [Flavonifractor plautii]